MKRALALAALGLCLTGCADKPQVTVYEDGSGVQYAGSREVRTFPEGTFWTAHTITVDGCTYNSSGAGRCEDGETIAPLTERDADFCADIDPTGSVITWCKR